MGSLPPNDIFSFNCSCNWLALFFGNGNWESTMEFICDVKEEEFRPRNGTILLQFCIPPQVTHAGTLDQLFGYVTICN